VPDFEISTHPSDANVLVFENTTQGEHYFWRWEFGNKERIDREPVSPNNVQSFYPEKGTFEVTLTIWGSASDLADNKKISKQVTIDEDVFTGSISVVSMAEKSNTYQLLNTTTGDFSEAIWTINGEEQIDDGQAFEVYYPFEGDYNIELKVLAGNYEKKVSETIAVDEDDSNFMDHYAMVWNDEFGGSSLEATQWSSETGQHGWGNAEWQNYTNGDNVEVSDGTLKIISKKIGDGQKVGDYTSARLNATQSFTYGIFEVRAKMPADKGPGVWPAIWMLGESIKSGTSWPLCGEMDIMEYVSWDPNTTSSSIHIESNNHAQGNAIGSGHLPLETAEEAFHNYGVIWTESFLRFYRDDMDNVILNYKKPNNATEKNWPFDQSFYFLLNMAVGGNYGGVNGVEDALFPATMEIDYVRIFQLN